MDAVRKTVAEDRFLSVPQTARELGKAHATVIALALRGELASEVVAGRTVITRASVDAFKQRVAAEATDSTTE